MTKFLYLLRTGLILTVVALCPLPGYSASISLNPVADSFVTPGSDGSLANNNYGAAGLLSVAAPGKPKGEFQSVLQFDFAAAKASFDLQYGAGLWSIQSVTLQLTAAPVNNVIFNTISAGQFSISWLQNDSWTEGAGTPGVPTTTGITWSTLPSFLGASDESLGTFSFNGTASGNTIYTLALTSGFTADLLAGGTIGFRTLAADSNISYLFNSVNFNTVAARPLLTVTVIPEPSSYALAGVGLGLMAWRQIRRRRPAFAR